MRRLLLSLACVLVASAVSAQNIDDYVPNPDCTTTSAGDFASAGIWSCGHVPGSTERAQISHNPVTWTTGNITVWTLYVHTGAAFTADFSADCGNTHTLTFSDTPYTDTAQFETGFISRGKVELTGCTVTPWLRLASGVSASATSLTLGSTPTNWKSAARVMLPDTREWRIGGVTLLPGEPDIETLSSDVSTTTAAVSSVNIVHPTARDASGTVRAYPFVANLDRNIVIKSANAAGTRGHVIFSDAADIDINYVAFQDTGRTLLGALDAMTNHIGRYAVHFHGMVGAPNPVFSHNVIERSYPTKWGLTIHGPISGTFSDNTIYDSNGAGIMTEEGNETSIIADNLVVLVHGDDGGGDEHFPTRGGENGDCVWLEGTLNQILRNVTADCQKAGIQIWDRLADGGVTDRRPIVSGYFDGNELVHTGFGFYPWYVGKLWTPSYITNGVSWHNVTDAFIYPTQSLYVEDYLMLGDPDYFGTLGFNTGWHFGDYDQRDFHMTGAEVQSKDTGIIAPFGVSGGGGGHPQPRTAYFTNLTFANNGTDFLQEFAGSVGCNLVGGCVARVSIVRNSLHSASYPSTYHFAKWYQDSTNVNLRVPFVLRVESYQGNSSDNFDVYAVSGSGHTQHSQEPDASMAVDGAVSGLEGCPTGGLTNAQCQSMYSGTTDGGYATGGKTTPVTATTRTKIDGKVDAFTPVTATYHSTDTTTFGAWRGVFGTTCAAIYGAGPLEGTCPSALPARNVGSMEAGGQFGAFGGRCSATNVIAVDHLIGNLTNSGSSYDCEGGPTVANGVAWPAGSGTGYGNYNRDDTASGTGPVRVIKFQAMRLGVGLTAPSCVRWYLTDSNNGNGNGPRTVHVDVYEMSDIGMLDTSNSLLASFLPLDLLDSRDIVVGTNNGVYPAWTASGRVVFEISAISPLNFLDGASGGMVVDQGLFLDPTCGSASSESRVRLRRR